MSKTALRFAARLLPGIALASLASDKARVAVRIHPVDHPAFEQDISTIAGKAGKKLSHVMIPKVESVQDV